MSLWSATTTGRHGQRPPPMLTTIEPNLQAVGKLAMPYLMAMINSEPGTGGSVWVAPELIIRESSAPALKAPHSRT
jgi:DNA-binding LacI/PurR family transcriptional regulator